MHAVLLSFALAAVDPRVETALAAIAEPDCPRLFAMLTPAFQQHSPRESWPKWCAFVGSLTHVESVGPKDGWLKFRGTNGTRRILFDIAFDREGKISGLMAMLDDSQSAADRAVEPDAKLLQVKSEHRLPALAALVMRGGAIVVNAAVGVRKLGDPTPARANDKWHLGSNTKAMTATLAALLVEEGRISWTSTVTEVLSQWHDIDPAFGKVTLEMLLAHGGGLPKQMPRELWPTGSAARSARSNRAHAVRALLRRTSVNVGRFAYSNTGYMVAGVMLEKAGDAAWEGLLRSRLFEPLGMASCGFGGPASRGKVDQPWAHRWDTQKGVPVPVAPGPGSDNPPALGPAGTVHCSLEDWAKFAALHLPGGRARQPPLSPATLVKLHAPLIPGSGYALGWGTGKRSCCETVLSHDGSNTFFYARIVLAPRKGMAFLVATNTAGNGAPRAMDQMIDYLIGRYVR